MTRYGGLGLRPMEERKDLRQLARQSLLNSSSLRPVNSPLIGDIGHKADKEQGCGDLCCSTDEASDHGGLTTLRFTGFSDIAINRPIIGV